MMIKRDPIPHCYNGHSPHCILKRTNREKESKGLKEIKGGRGVSNLTSRDRDKLTLPKVEHRGCYTGEMGVVATDVSPQVEWER
uniref:Uncharacterized protein n=1 Tax=Nymphaea colorata TaxID=210225 RepID=A0A5K1EVB6_9MAGN|nr:unnamed protein product [Nymphaea colorata]